MEQFEQLLTCAICLDRYRNPKLLPCQHSFCMEPCLEGLVDYVRRQVSSKRIFFKPQTTHVSLGEMSRMQSRTPNPLSGRTGFPHKRNPTKISRAPHRNNRGATRPNQWTGDGALQCLFGKSVLQFLCTLRQKDLRGLQKRPHGHPEARDCQNQQPNQKRDSQTAGHPIASREKHTKHPNKLFVCWRRS